MKIRQGFVSNSSSSSFIFVFKKDNDFYNLLDKYSVLFGDVIGENREYSYQDFKRCMRNDEIEFNDISVLVNKMKHEIELYKDLCKEEEDLEENCDVCYVNQLMSKIHILENDLMRLEEFIEKYGFDTCAEQSFGDSEGNVCGDMGSAFEKIFVHCEGLVMNRSDIMIFKEVNR